jgi:hypothetical protein
MITGTNHFPSILAACLYYRPQGFSAADIDQKIACGEIKLGPPPLKPGQRYFVHENRYHIKD